MTYTPSPGSQNRTHPTLSPSSSYTSSPIRHSPLSQPPLFAPSRTPSPSHARVNDARPIPTPTHHRRTSANDAARHPSLSYSPSSHTPSPTSSRYIGRSSASPHQGAPVQATPPSPLSRSQPLLGSYHLSLLHSRMSHAHPPHPPTGGFSMHLGSLGRGVRCPPELRCPKHLVVPFSATHYSLQDDLDGPFPGASGGAKSTPWVGNVDLVSHYIGELSRTIQDPHGDPFLSSSMGASNSRNTPIVPPEVPGYQVAPRGQLQILVRTAASPMKVFLIPYDLRKMPFGGRLLVREKSYLRTSRTDGSASPPKEVLKHAIQLQFVCVEPAEHYSSDGSPLHVPIRKVHDPPSTPRAISKISKQSDPVPDRYEYGIDATPTKPRRAYYVTKSIRMVFSSHCDPTDEVRTERHDELIRPSPSASPSTSVSALGARRTSGKEATPSERRQSDTFGPFSPSSLRQQEEWADVRRRWLEARGQGRAWTETDEDEGVDFDRELRDGVKKDGQVRARGGQSGSCGTRERTWGIHSARDADEPGVFSADPGDKSPIPIHIPVISTRPNLDRRPSLLSTTQPQQRPMSHQPRAEPFETQGMGTMPSSSLSPSHMPPPAVQSPLPTLLSSPRATRHHTHNSNGSAVARPSTPTLLTPRPTSPSVWSPGPGNRRMTREDGREEVELSERLRRMGVGEGMKGE